MYYFILVFKGVLLLCKTERGRRPYSSEAKLLGVPERHEGIMDSSKYCVMNCFLENFEVLWSEHAFAFFHHVIDGCHF